MEPLTVLITNVILNGRTGTELYVRDVALELVRRGHRPIVYSTLTGELADELRDHTVHVTEQLASLAAVGVVPDVIHGHHLLETAAAMLTFPEAATAFFCHDAGAWVSSPPALDSLQTFVAVDEACADRLCLRDSIPRDLVTIVPNAVDLDRFATRRPLPMYPRRALVFSNYAHEGSHLPAIEQACEERDIALDVIGSAAGTSTTSPERVLGEYDLVFAKARCALEAMAVGCAVVVCDHRGLAGMVTSDTVDAWRPLNFGLRCLTNPIDADRIGTAIDDYRSDDASAVSAHIRKIAALPDMIDSILDVYERALVTRDELPPGPHLPGLATQLEQWSPRLWEADGLQEQLAHRVAHIDQLEPYVAKLLAELDRHRDHVTELEGHVDNLEKALSLRDAQVAELEQHLANP